MDELVIDEAYRHARKHNRRSEDMVFFELDKYANIARLAKSVNAKSYTPRSNYSFIHRRGNKPREVFAAEPELKIIMAFLLDRIGPIIESRLLPCTFNNRVGMGTQAAVNKVIENIYVCSHGYTKPCWVIKYDFKGYFPNINQDKAYAQLKALVESEYHGADKGEVLYALSIACFCGADRSYRKSPLWEWADIAPYKSVYSRPDGIGAMIGYHLWQIEASLYPVEIDNFIVENITPYYVRFVDDSVLVTDNKEMVLAMMPTIRKMCASLEITLHPKKFYCQSYEHGLEFLGYHIAPGRVHLNNRIVSHAFLAAKDTSRDVTSFVNSLNSYIGMIKGASDLYVVKNLLDMVDRECVEKDYERMIIRDTRKNNYLIADRIIH